MGVGTFGEVVAIFIVAPFSAAAVVAVVVAVVDVHQVVGKDDFAVVHAVLSALGQMKKKTFDWSEKQLNCHKKRSTLIDL